MAFRDVREFIDRLETEGELTRIKQEVDWNLEAGAILRRCSEMDGTAPFFEKIKGYPPGYSILGGAVASRRRLAIAMGMPKDSRFGSMMDFWDKGTSQLVKPRIVTTGPCKENILKGDDVNLYKFPIPMVSPGDGGRYLTWLLVAVKDPDSEWVNWGCHRMMVYNRNHLGGMVMAMQHIAGFLRRYEELNQTPEFAAAIGTEPISPCVASSAIPYGVSEVDVAGGLRGEPVELVKCETVDLMVPATAEIILEGHILKGVFVDEGPFGEFTGYRASPRCPRTVYSVNCITHRNDPILTSATMGMPWTETSAVGSLQASCVIREELRRNGLPIVDVHVAAEAATMLCIVSTKTPYPGIAHRIASIIWSNKQGINCCKVMVMNDDVDPTNWLEVIHAFVTKCHPVRGTHTVADATGHPLIPYQNLEERIWAKGSNVLYDCTWPIDWPVEIAVPPKVAFKTIYTQDLQDKVLNNWKDYGFND